MNIASFEIHLAGEGGGPLTSGFEEAAARMASIDRLDLEPDGFFVWMIDAATGRQLSGMLYDDGRQLQYVHIRGNCLWQDLQQLVQQICSRGAAFCVTELPSGRLQDLQTFKHHTWPPLNQPPEPGVS